MATGLRFRGDDSAAFAANWRTLLAVDLSMAVAVLAAGLIVVVGFGQRWGWLLMAAGAVYVFFVGGRVARWRRLRRDAAGAADPPS